MRTIKRTLLAPIHDLIFDGVNKRINLSLGSRLSTRQFSIFLAGLLDGDGYFSQGKYELCNYNSDLASLQELALWNGIFCTKQDTTLRLLNCDKLPVIKSKRWGDRSIIKGAERTSKQRSRQIKYRAHETGYWVKITSVGLSSQKVEMIDIETTDHLFVTRGILTHNCDGFDIPYLINRTTSLLSEEAAKSLSPIHSLFLKTGVVNIFGVETTKWIIRALTVFDYMELYRTFSRGESDSYKLGDVCARELNFSKIAHTAGDLVTLADTDWDLFVAYNIQDVNLLIHLEKKLKFLELARFIALQGFAKLENALGKVTIVAGAIAAQALSVNKVAATFYRPKGLERGEYQGGFVRDPVRGMHKNIVSYDANSLYPNVIITLNLSPETKVARIVNYDSMDTDEKITLAGTDGLVRTISKQQFAVLLEKGQCTLSKAGILYSQKFKGIVPQFIDQLYQRRVDLVAQITQLQEAKDKLSDSDELRLSQLDLLQYTIKILLNSVYGNFANESSPLFDLDGAGSITMTSQSVIKQAGTIANNWANQQYPTTSLRDIVIYGDTDSCYLTLQDLPVDLLTPEEHKLTPQGDNVVASLGDSLANDIANWAKSDLRSTDPRIVFKRESICASALFIEKKRYILQIDYSGNKYVGGKFKFVGVEVARSTFSDTAKTIIKRIIKTLFDSHDAAITTKCYHEALQEFRGLQIDDAAIRVRLGKLKQWTAGADGLKFINKTPYHIRGAIAHNHLVKTNGLSAKYPDLQEGNKCKYTYVKTNQYGIKGLAYGDEFPRELGIEPDYDRMFSKEVQSTIARLFTPAGWSLPTTLLVPEQTLFEMFS